MMLKDEKFVFTTVTGSVIENRQWSETHISGGGGGTTPLGNIHIDKIKSSTVQKQSVWIEDENGRQFEMSYTGDEKVAMRQGHRMTFVYVRATRKADKPKFQHLAITHNNTTGETHIQRAAISSAVDEAVRFGISGPLLYFGGIYALNFGERHPEYLLSAFLMLVPCIVLSYLRHRPCRKRLERLLQAEKLRLGGLPLQRAADAGAMTAQSAA